MVLLQNLGHLCFEMSLLLQALGLRLQIRQILSNETSLIPMGSNISLPPPLLPAPRQECHQTRQSEKPLQSLILRKYLTLPKPSTVAEVSADFRLFVGLIFSLFLVPTKSFTYHLCKWDIHPCLSRSCANTITGACEALGCQSIKHDTKVCMQVRDAVLHLRPWDLQGPIRQKPK